MNIIQLASRRGRESVERQRTSDPVSGFCLRNGYKMTNNNASVQSPLCGPYWKTMERKNEMLKTIPPIPLRYIEVKDSLNPTAPPELKNKRFLLL